MPKSAKICVEVEPAKAGRRRSRHHDNRTPLTANAGTPQSAAVVRLHPSRDRRRAEKSHALTPLLEALEIEIIGLTAYRGPNQTAAAATLQDILAAHGEKHFIMLMRTITESKGNAQALINPVIYAVSDVMLAFPKWTSRGLAWIESFDGIRLLDLMLLARKLRPHVAARAAIAGMLARMLQPIFDPPKVPRALKPPEPMRRSGAMRAIAEGLLLLECKGPHSNSPIRRAADEILGTRRSEASKCMNAARLYGERPELFERLSRNGIFELTAPATPAKVRERVEEMLAAGEKVGARAIIAMRKVSVRHRPSP